MMTSQAAPVIRTRIHTKERRFLFDDVTELERFLRERADPIEYVAGRPETQITTVYLDTPEGSWSVGKTKTKFRCKSYQDPNCWWFEVKQRRGVRVDKWRKQVDPKDLAPVLEGVQRGELLNRFIGRQPLIPLVAVNYRRIAFEIEDARITIDRQVSFYLAQSGVPWSIGRALGVKSGHVVEVKRDGGFPNWLRPAFEGHPRQRFSKSKWALLARKQA
jgi:hypothetical protein